MQLAPMLWNLEGLPASIEGFELAGESAVPPLQVRLRQYRDSDREEVRRICCDTGFLGNRIDGIFRDRELFADLFTSAYLDNEPEWTLVAEKGGQVAGYLTGSVNPNFTRTLMRSGFQTVWKMLGRLLTGKYGDHPRSEQFVRWVLARGLLEQPKHPDGAAHLHLNLERPLRWGSVARRLLATFEGMVLAAGKDHYYVKFFSCPQRNPERMYDRLGFQIYDRVETTIFRPEIADPVYTVCSHKRLNGAAARH
jgi:hypothetical protein